MLNHHHFIQSYENVVVAAGIAIISSFRSELFSISGFLAAILSFDEADVGSRLKRHFLVGIVDRV